jgi:cytosine/adenosine deaminase-related metal-dependent hydrolase
LLHSSPGATAYTAACVFDGKSERVTKDGDVAEGDRVASAGPIAEAPPVAEILELDATLLPGPIDAHVHPSGTPPIPRAGRTR